MEQLEFPLARLHLPPRPDPPGPAPPSSSGGAGAMTTIPMSCETAFGWKETGLTEDNHQGENVNPILLKERLLRFWLHDLAFRGERRR